MENLMLKLSISSKWVVICNREAKRKKYNEVTLVWSITDIYYWIYKVEESVYLLAILEIKILDEYVAQVFILIKVIDQLKSKVT